MYGRPPQLIVPTDHNGYSDDMDVVVTPTTATKLPEDKKKKSLLEEAFNKIEKNLLLDSKDSKDIDKLKKIYENLLVIPTIPEDYTQLTELKDKELVPLVHSKMVEISAPEFHIKEIHIKMTASYYKNEVDNRFMKIYKYNTAEDPNFYLIAKILAEIYLQQKAFSLHATCKFKTPEIYRYGFITNVKEEDTVEFYIEMDFIGDKTIQDLHAINIQVRQLKKALPECQKLRKIEKCLRSNDIFHNDLNVGNILVSDDDKNDVSIIDWGESSQTYESEVDKLFRICGPRLPDIPIKTTKTPTRKFKFPSSGGKTKKTKIRKAKKTKTKKTKTKKTKTKKTKTKKTKTKKTKKSANM